MSPSINPSASLLKHFESIDDPRIEYLIERAFRRLINRVLIEYKGQQSSERGFRFLKDPLFFYFQCFRQYS